MAALHLVGLILGMRFSLWVWRFHKKNSHQPCPKCYYLDNLSLLGTVNVVLLVTPLRASSYIYVRVAATIPFGQRLCDR
ncbi:uncharacterized protein EI90DRAFT_3040571 [Cantharellus anzutake]|uniref:uncharacterized protein n=1 Tax=Cantharellus anzutake TaxID=1750568 RepID=UPI001907FCA8|nr:uncharacterized protein EI90DRAFT_3040571 [Cantharellus anzutake]KAF8339132.1 hypothetical protein EI90DRAFT_3040571 [Cantharellus anzutake]